MNLDCMAQYLINAKLATALGVDIFEYHMPENISQGILLKTAMEGIPVHSYLKDYFNGRFQVILRAAQHGDADAIAASICKTLTFQEQTFLDSSGTLLMHVLLCRPITLPIVYPRSTGNLYEWSCNFLAHYTMPFELPPSELTVGLSELDTKSPIIVNG